jgi:hypothetical protein
MVSFRKVNIFFEGFGGKEEFACYKLKDPNNNEENPDC